MTWTVLKSAGRMPLPDAAEVSEIDCDGLRLLVHRPCDHGEVRVGWRVTDPLTGRVVLPRGEPSEREYRSQEEATEAAMALVRGVGADRLRGLMEATHRIDLEQERCRSMRRYLQLLSKRDRLAERIRRAYREAGFVGDQE